MRNQHKVQYIPQFRRLPLSGLTSGFMATYLLFHAEGRDLACKRCKFIINKDPRIIIRGQLMPIGLTQG